MSPETKVRQQIDQKLEQAGWVVQDMRALNLAASLGVAEVFGNELDGLMDEVNRELVG
ncbi:hypothetical protein [Candidatus Igneacidithiobacillus taiwanensis]|uniref:hypothetical protein n=1 Tax=Candidatus Igneacidithiobacillus taiwanensis TaxID=1945924 RepID=UPI0028964095|nr:hypothetical protein [Candidatus Igneacidithiobacillus taiwanensis]MCE5360683.1 hypothetical protein [Acidithiobacillus sp.]